MHFMRNVLTRVTRGNAVMVAAALRTVFAQSDAEHVRSQLDVIAPMLGRQFPAVKAMLRDTRDDLLAFTGFPVTYWKKIEHQPAQAAQQGDQAAHRRRRRVPNPPALLRLAGAVLVEAHDEWQVSRRYLSEGSMALLQPLTNTPEEVAQPALIASRSKPQKAAELHHGAGRRHLAARHAQALHRCRRYTPATQTRVSC